MLSKKELIEQYAQLQKEKRACWAFAFAMPAAAEMIRNIFGYDLIYNLVGYNEFYRHEFQKLRDLTLQQEEVMQSSYLFKYYNEFLTEINRIISSLEMNHPIKMQALLSELLHEGYFSMNKKFNFNTKKSTTKKHQGLNVISGSGVCENTAVFTKDLMNNRGYNSGIVICKTMQENESYIKNIATFRKKSFEENFSRLSPQNHVVTIVEYESKRYVIDILNKDTLIPFSRKKMKYASYPAFIKIGFAEDKMLRNDFEMIKTASEYKQINKTTNNMQKEALIAWAENINLFKELHCEYAEILKYMGETIIELQQTIRNQKNFNFKY